MKKILAVALLLLSFGSVAVADGPGCIPLPTGCPANTGNTVVKPLR